MRKIFLTLSVCASLAASALGPAPLGGFKYGDVAAPDGSEWQDCQNLSLNKEQPRAWFFNFATVDQAKKVLPENSPYYKSLDGTWKFNWVNHPDKRPQDFYQTNFDASGWDDIAVPGCWNVQGIQKDGSLKYGKPIYVNQLVPFVTHRVPDDWRGGVMRTPPEHYTTFTDRNEVGSYRRNFTVPADWKGREVFINFDGVDSFFYLWINGKYVGFSKNSRNTASFNITKYLNPKGENTVALEVYRYSDAGMLEAQDMFRLPGIIRSTYLTSVPSLEINDLVVRTTIPADANPQAPVTAEVTVDALIRNLGNKPAKLSELNLQVYPVEFYSDKTGEMVSNKSVKVEPTFKAEPGSTQDIHLSFSLENAKLWSAETPNRYVLVAQLNDKKGKPIETVSTYFGVRHVEIRDTKAEDDEFGLAGRYFYVNNRPVKLKGVNRHENNLNTGHTLSHEQMEKEVMLMKQANINHVRNSHYNDDPYWYELCDKYGIYLEDEANLESHEFAYQEASLSHVPEWENAHVARNMEMVRAHVNHPSIVIWSLGNEAGPGKNFVTAYNAIKSFDTSRPVQYERNNGIVDMGSNQYPSIPWVRDAVKGTMNIKYPFHISEYAHSMGNALGNFVDYWDAMESTNFFCGGAIWDWVDQAIWNYTPDGTKYMAYGGDFGDHPNDGMFCMNGIMFPDLTPKPQYHEVKRVHQYVGVKSLDPAEGTVEIFNKNYFTTLDDLQPVWSLTRNGVEVASGKDVKRPRMSVGPRESQVWSIPYDFASLDDEGEYFVTLQFLLNEDKPWAKAGYVQAEVQLPVKSPKAFAPLSVAPSGNVSLISEDEVSTVKGPGFEVAFNNETGSIQSLTYGNQEIITPGNGPVLNALRAPVDNDTWDRGKWWQLGLNDLRHKVLDYKTRVREDGAVILSYTVESQAPNAYKIVGGGESGVYTVTPGREFGPDDFKFTTNQIWTVYPDGSIELESAISSNEPNQILPRLGYAMTLPAELSNYTYYGRGPVNNYNDRKTSQKIGLYKSTVADQFVPFPKPQEMGNREELRWNALTDAAGNGIQFVALNGTMSASALPWTDNEMTAAAHPYQLPESKGTFLHIDKKVTGLGGASCGQDRALPEDRTMGTAQTFGFLIRPIAAGADLQKQAQVAANGERPLSIFRDRVGNVTITSDDPNAKIVYNVTPIGMKVQRGRYGNNRNQDYTGAFNMSKGGKLVAWDANSPEQVFVVNYPAIESIPVTVINASSAEPGDEAAKLVDGDPSSIWHSTYGVTVALYPHWVDFDCAQETNIKGFTYLPRPSGSNGDIKDWRVEVSNDNENWTEVAHGTFENNKNLKRVDFEPVKARYLRFVGLSSQNGADYAAGAEFTILAD